MQQTASSRHDFGRSGRRAACWLARVRSSTLFLSSVLALLGLSALPGCGGDLDTDARDAGTTPRDSGGPGTDGDVVPDDAGPADAGAPACAEGPPRGALAFDGTDDHVTMGRAPALGLEQFTVEAWVRRDGRGAAAGTGVGGLSLVPIAGKGRGENDDTVKNCNYAFGFVGDVLGADFEDMADGGNHPVLGRTRVGFGEWHHVAATYDGTTWRLYLDGVLDGTARADATPRHDSIQHFGVGTALDSAGTPAGRLDGAISELRVWSRARTAAEIEAARFERIETDDGLVGRWSFHEGDGAGTDSAGDLDATITGATWVDSGPTLERGLPPVVAGAAPTDGLAVTGTSVELALDVDDPEGETLDVSFHVRALGEDDDFTIVVLPDTQYYTVDSRNLERFFYDQTQWVIDNHDAYDIRAVIHNGDLVNNGDDEPFQWRVADRAMSTLEDALPALADGIPYGVAVGNHDQTVRGVPGRAVSYNANFGVARFQGRSYYGGRYGSENNNNSWFTFSAGGLDFIVVNLEYDTSPDAAVLAWARRIFQTHPEHFGILNSHSIVSGSGAFTDAGQGIYNGVRAVQNLHLMTCGHISAEARRTDTHEGHPIISMLADYQSRDQGGGGHMRIWELSPANGEMTVRTYSPTLDRWETDGNSEFTLRIPLRGAGGAFSEAASVMDVTTRATATIADLEPGRVYEWYATVSDCEHTVRTPVARFTTTSP